MPLQSEKKIVSLKNKNLKKTKIVKLKIFKRLKSTRQNLKNQTTEYIHAENTPTVVLSTGNLFLLDNLEQKLYFFRRILKDLFQVVSEYIVKYFGEIISIKNANKTLVNLICYRK